MGGGSSWAAAWRDGRRRRMRAKASESRFMAGSFAHFVAPARDRYDVSYESEPTATNRTRVNRMELEEQLEQLHSASFAWALSCCNRDREDAEEVLQNVYVKVPE